MADTPYNTWVGSLSALASSVQAADTFPVVRGGVTYRAAGSQLPASAPTAEQAFRYCNDFYYRSTAITASTDLADTGFRTGGSSNSASFPVAENVNVAGARSTGCVILNSGSGNTSYIYCGCYSYFKLSAVPSGQEAVFNMRLSATNSGTTLSNATNRWTELLGVVTGGLGAITYNDNIPGAYFRYSDDINAGKWQAVLCNGTTKTVVDTGVTVAARTWAKFQIRFDPRTSGGNGVRYYINGALVATIAGSDSNLTTVINAVDATIVAGTWTRVGLPPDGPVLDYLEAIVPRP